MSDEEYMSEESYEFEFEDDDGSDEGGEYKEELNDEEQLQNDYYQAKAFKDEDPAKSIQKLQLLVDSNQVKSDTIAWIYKSIKQIAKIHYYNHDFERCLHSLAQLKPLLLQMSDLNYLDESMNRVFNNYSNNKDNLFLLKLHEILLEFLEIIKNQRPSKSYNSSDRLWIKINLNKFSILLDQRYFDQCFSIISSLNDKLAQVSDVTKNSYSLEVIASEIELLSMTGDFNIDRLTSLYQNSLNIVSPVTHPRIIGVIKQCGGKLEFYNKNFEESRSNFYESFKNFDESGSIVEKNQSFKYLILLSIITENEFNPFESQETQHYIQEPEFEPLIMILENFNDLNLHAFNTVTQTLLVSDDKNDEFLQDDIFQQSVEIINKLIIEKILLNIFKSFSSVSFQFIQDHLKLADGEDELVDILMKLGTEGKLFSVKINFVDKIITTTTKGSGSLKLPHDLSAKKILFNLRRLNAIDFSELFTDEENQSMHPGVSLPSSVETTDNDDMNIDPEIPAFKLQGNVLLFDYPSLTELLNKKLYFLKSPTEDKPLKSVEEWFKLLQTSFPHRHREELSTKDQIYSEQKLNKTTIENDTSISGNVLASSQIQDLEHTEDPQVDYVKEKLRLLNLLSTELLYVMNSS